MPSARLLLYPHLQREEMARATEYFNESPSRPVPEDMMPPKVATSGAAPVPVVQPPAAPPPPPAPAGAAAAAAAAAAPARGPSVMGTRSRRRLGAQSDSAGTRYPKVGQYVTTKYLHKHGAGKYRNEMALARQVDDRLGKVFIEHGLMDTSIDGWFALDQLIGYGEDGDPEQGDDVPPTDDLDDAELERDEDRWENNATGAAEPARQAAEPKTPAEKFAAKRLGLRRLYSLVRELVYFSTVPVEKRQDPKFLGIPFLGKRGYLAARNEHAEAKKAAGAA